MCYLFNFLRVSQFLCLDTDKMLLRLKYVYVDVCTHPYFRFAMVLEFPIVEVSAFKSHSLDGTQKVLYQCCFCALMVNIQDR